jgi:hypothetical protein
MAAIQEISARIGRVTGVGIAANLRKNYPRPLLYGVLFVVSVANVFNHNCDAPDLFCFTVCSIFEVHITPLLGVQAY